MVDENFKIGLSLELEEESLESIARQVQRKINGLFKQPSQRAAGPVVKGGTATVRSAGQAISVNSREIGKAVADAISKETSGFSKATQEVVKAVNALTRAVERQAGPPGGGGRGSGSGGGGGGGRSPDGIDKLISRLRDRVTLGRNLAARQQKETGTVDSKLLKRLEIEQQKLQRAVELREKRLQRLNRTSQELERSEEQLIAANKALARHRQKQASQAGPDGGVPVSGRVQRGVKEQLTERQIGRSNVQRAANIDASRRGGAPATAGGGGGGSRSIIADAPRRQDMRRGDITDNPRSMKSAEKRVSARESAAEPVQKAVVGQVTQSLKELRNMVAKNAPAGVDVNEQLFESVGLGLKTIATIGPGAAAAVEGLGKHAKHVHATLVIAGKKLESFSNTVSDAASNIVNDTERWARANRAGRRDPQAFTAHVRGMMRQVGETAPPIEKNLPLAPYAKGGEVKLLVKLDAEQQKRINALDQEADRQAELNRILFESASSSTELSKALKDLGITLLTTAGLSEDIAGDRANFREIRAVDEEGRPGQIEAIETVMQSRGLAEVGPGGRGAVKAQRMAQAYRLAELEGGSLPGVIAPAEKDLYEKGAFRPGAFQEVKAALFDPSVLAETFEDQFVFDPNIFKPVMKESSSVLVKNLKEGLEVGATVLKDQVIGSVSNALTGEEQAVTPDFKGAEGKVKEIEKIWIDGIEGIKVTFESLNDAVTGMKLTERGGSKGIARAQPGFAKQMGLPEDVGLAISSRAVGARANIRTMTEMISNNISDATGVGASEISEKIMSAMKEGGASFYEAGMKVARELGLVEIPGVHEITEGPLSGQRVVTGRVAMGRLPEHGVKGSMDISERFLSGPDIAALKGRADTAKFAEQAVADLRILNSEFSELDRTLESLTGDSQRATEGLREVFPEELNRLPQQAAHSLEELKNTLADPAFSEAFKLMVPTREGGTRGLRVSAVGSRVGERDIFKDALGGVGSGKLTRLFDQIVEQAAAARVALGQVPLEEGSTQFKEASEITSKTLRDLATEVARGAKESEEGAQRAREFVAQFRPLVEALGEGPAGLKYEIAGRERSVKRSAAGYVDYMDEKMTKPRSLESQVYAVSDVLGERAATGGSKAQLGAVHSNVQILNEAMKLLGVTLGQNSEAAEKAISRLEKLEEELIDMLATRGLSASKPNEDVGRSAAQAKEAGVLRGPVGTIINFAVDSKEALESLGVRLLNLRDAGVDVDAALASVEKNLDLQETGFLKIGRDELLINRKDFEKWAADMSKTKGMSLESAKTALLEQPVATGRYPITGARSIVPKKLKVVGDEVLPPGHLGVGGITPTASSKDLENILGAAGNIREVMLDEMANVSRGLAELNTSGRGASQEAQELQSQLACLREDLSKLNGEISAIIPVFEGAGQNADYDGDKMFAAGLAAEKAANQIYTLADEVAAGAVSFRGVWAQVAGAEIPKGGMGDWSQMEDYFGRIAKGRVAGVTGGRLQPVGAELIGKESHALVAGKKSVGLLTDMFNSMLVTVQTGTGEMNDAMEAGIGGMMLGINESLAQKHGSGGATGPAQFLSALRKGKLGDIKSALGSGEGFLGKLDKQWGAVQDEMKNRLYALDFGALKEFAGKHGLAGKFQEVFDRAGGNLMEVSDALVDELNLYNIIKQMFEQMKENAKAALMASGLSETEAAGKVQAQLTPNQKGSIKGLDQQQIAEYLAPGYAATRSRAQEAISEMSPLEKAQMARQMIARPGQGESYNVGEQLSEALDRPMQNLAQTLDAIKTFVGSAIGQVTRVPKEEMEARFGQGVQGAHLAGAGGQAGQVLIREDIVQQGVAAFAVLQKVLEGTITPAEIGAEGLQALQKALLSLVGIPTHEFVHRESKVFQDSVMNMVRQLNDLNSAFGQNGAAIQKFIQRKGNLKETFENLGKMRSRVESGDTGANFRGIKGMEGLKAMEGEAQKLLAEELMAVASEGRLQEAMGNVPEAVKNAILEQLNELANARPEVFRAAADAMGFLRSGVIEGLMDTAQQQGPSAARATAGARVEGNLQFAGRERFVKGLEVLEQQEKAIVGGRGYHRLSSSAMGPEGLEFGDLPQPPGGMQDDTKLREYWDEYLRLLKTLRETGDKMDPDALKQLQSEMNRSAGQVQQRMRSLKKTTKYKDLDVEPFQEMQKMHREWSATRMQVMTKRARELQVAINEMQRSGEVDTPQFGALLREFEAQLQATHDEMTESLQPRGKSHLTRSPLATAKGVLLPESAGLGMEMRAESYQAAAGMAAGPGDEGEAFIKRYAATLEQVIGMVKSGVGATEVWSRIFAEVEKHPESMQADLHKIQQYLGDSARIIGYENGQFSEAAKNLQEVSKWAKRTRDSLEGIDTSSIEKIQEVLMSGSKQQKISMARALGGGDTQASLRKQMEAMQAAIEQRRQMLKKLASTGALDAFGPAGKEFEGQQFELIDPKTGQTVQKFSATFRRFGKDVNVAFSQAGAAANAFGTQMRNAFRRVVQWGLASGIVYGTARALRNLVSVMSDVETRVTNLKKVMDLATTNFEYMQDSAVQMGKTFGIATEEVLDGMVVYAQQGLKMNEIMDRTKATLLAVNVTTLSATEATEALTAAQKLFGSTVDTSARFVDMWGSVASRHAVTAKDLAMATQRSGAAAKTAGLEYQDFLGIVTAIGAVTRQTGKEIATGTKFMFRAMRQPSAQKELMGLGIQSQTGGGDLRPAMDVLGELAGKWEGLSKAQQLSTAQAMSGIRHYNQFIVLMENFQEVLDASADATNSQGFAARKNVVAMQTFSKQMQVLREEIKGVALDLGKAMLPAMKLGVQAVQTLVSVLEGVPDVMKQIGVAGAAGFMAFGRGADVVLDTLDAFSGTKFQKTQDGFQKMGAVGRIKGMGTKLSSFGGSIADVWKGGKIAEDAGVVSTGILNIVKSFKSMGLAARVASVAAVGALGAVVGIIGWWLANAPKTGKELEEGLAPGIGAALDQADALAAAQTRMKGLGVQAAKAQSILAKASDPAQLKTAVDEGSFKGPGTALRELRDAQANFAQHMAKTMPGMVKGMNELGEYTLVTSAAFSTLAASAADMARASAFDMQLEAMSGFNKELVTAIDLSDRLREKMNQMVRLGAKVSDFLGIEMPTSIMEGDAFGADTLLEKYENITSEVERLSRMREAGQDVESQWAHAIERQIELRGEVIERLKETKRILEEMPVFEEMGMAATKLGPDLAGQISQAVDMGVFGRGATTSSVMMKQMGKSAGFGGMLDYESAATVGGTLEAFMQRGVGVKGMQGGDLGSLDKSTGDLIITSKEAAQALLNFKGAMSAIDPRLSHEAVTAAQQLIVEVDETTGEAIYRFYDSVGQTWQQVNGETMNAVSSSLSEEGKKLAVVSRKSMEDAMEATRRILTLQYTGAMAGIRVPGNVDIGPARFSEVTSNQRMMGTLVEEMQELSDIQGNITQKAREFNEEMSAEGLTEGSKQVKALGSDMLEVIMDLQQRGFKLSVIAHYTQAMHDLNKTMEDAAEAARKVMREEQARYEASMNFSGALKGLQVLPQLDFGKSLKELSGLERLQLERPDLGGAISMAGGMQQRARAQQQRTVDAKLQADSISKMISDLEARGGALTAEQQAKRAELVGSGMDAQTAEIISSILESSASEIDVVSQSLDVQTRMLEGIQSVDLTLIDQTKLLAEIARLNSEMEEARGLPDAEQRGRKMAEVKGERQKLFDDTLRSASLGDIDAMFRAGGANVAQMRGQAISETLGVRVGKSVEGERQWSAIGKGAGGEMSAEGQRAFEEFRTRWIEAKNEVEEAAGNLAAAKESGSKINFGDAQAAMDEAMFNLEQVQVEMLSDDDIRKFYEGTSKKLMANLATAENAVGKGGHAEQVDNEGLNRKMAVYRNALQKASMLATDAMDQTTQAFNQAAMEVSEPWRIVDAVGNFAKAIEQQIQSFKKAEMLQYDKIGSDLEGPFARVGKAGFKTDFEQRREEIQARRFGGPRSLDQMRADTTDRAAVDFDEKEARIKQAQDKEVAALKEQQSQAESLRSVMADALLGGDLAGTGLEGMTKSFMDTLTDELATSEQATTRGGELFFKGVPALEDASRFLQKIKELQEKKAQEAAQAAAVETMKKGNQPIVEQLVQQSDYLKQIIENTKKAGDAAQEGKSIPGVMAPNIRGMSGSAVSSAAGALGMAPIGSGLSTYGLNLTGAQLSSGPSAGVGPLSGPRISGHSGMYSLEHEMDPRDEMFVKEQSFRFSGGKSTSPITSAEGLKMLQGLESRTPGSQSFRSTGLFSSADAYNQDAETLDFSNLLDKQVGVSNFNQLQEAAARRRGDSSASPGGIISTSTGTPGALTAQDRLQREQAAGGGSADIAQVIGEQIGALSETLNTLAQGGFQLPPDFATEIGSIGAAFSEALGETLTVQVDGEVATTSSDVVAALAEALTVAFADAPTVIIDGLDTSFSTAIESSSLGTKLESVVSAVGEGSASVVEALSNDLNVNIASQSSDLTIATDALVTALGDAVDASEIGSAVADAVAGALTDIGPDIASAIAAEELTVNITNDTLAVSISNVSDIQAALADAIDSSGLSSVGSDVADSRLRLDVIESIIDTEGGRSLDDQLTEKIQTATTPFRNQIDTLSTEVDRIDTQIQDQILGGTNGLPVLRGKAESALSIAQDALNQARRI